MGYEQTLFDTSKVHTIDIIIDDWDSFISTCESETYSVCTVVIDNEAMKNVAIRGKGKRPAGKKRNGVRNVPRLLKWLRCCRLPHRLKY